MKNKKRILLVFSFIEDFYIKCDLNGILYKNMFFNNCLDV